MRTSDVFKRVAHHRTNAPPIDPDVGDGIALIGSDEEDLVAPRPDADIAAWRDGAVRTGRSPDGAAAVIRPAATAGVDPMGIHGGICPKYGLRRDPVAAVPFHIPAAEAVVAAEERIG